MNLRIAQVIFRKELLDTLRDRRTLFMMIGLPVILYPLLIIAGLQFALVQQAQRDTAVARVAITPPWPEVRDWLGDAPRIEIVDAPDAEEAVLDGDADVAVRVLGRGPEVLERNGSLGIELLYDTTDFASIDAALRLEGEFANLRARLQSDRLDRAGIEDDFIHPLEVSRVNIAPPGKTTGNLIGLVLPMLMVLMIAFGAVYPAIDITAGEKERGTLETLLSTPASKLDIVAGKFLAVFTLAMITGLLNLASMAGTFAVTMSQANAALDGTLPFEFQLPLASAGIIVLAMIPLGVMISAIMMAVAVFARSFKEGQNFVTPVLLVISLPAGLAALPGVALNAYTAIPPILNVVLLFRALLTGEAEFLPMLITLASTAAAALAALLLATWLFHREEVILSSDDADTSLFSGRKAGIRPTMRPGHAIVLYLSLIVLMFYITPLLHERAALTGVLLLHWGLLLPVTLAALVVSRVRVASALQLRTPPLTTFLGALLIGSGGVILLLQASVYHNRVLPAPPELQEYMNRLIGDSYNQYGLAWLMFTVAITPAITEEVLFRGVLLSAWRKVLPPFVLVVFVAVLFGSFHLSVHRLFGTTLIGLALTYTALRTRSLYPSMLLHALNNGTMLIIGTGLVPFIDMASLETDGFPWSVLVLGLGLLLLGVALIERSAHRNQA
ncbi:MAG: ABC transporter permease subunit [Candidatus Hydrogenedens sp.]|nr:ABC transporter permease subunit [Candidatus Hydrogenedens sp.]